MGAIFSRRPDDPGGGLTFRLLGPVEVLREGVSVPVRGDRARALLALLLVNANTVISGAQIVDAVWGQWPPATVRTQVHVRVSALRKLLAGVRGASIQTHPAGYRLAVDRGQVDLAVFTELSHAGRAALRQQRVAEAARTLHQALDLWRGPALGGVRAPFVPSTVVRLEEHRLTAFADRVAADLGLGRHHDVIPELRSLLDERPLLERARAQLMVALHLAGRRGDALAVYREGCALLRTELGVDPGPELSRAHRRLLGTHVAESARLLTHSHN
ncbi:AfsR/SARP family transcriptional regulator [Actinomycetes bacterium KLBMP 9797]